MRLFPGPLKQLEGKLEPAAAQSQPLAHQPVALTTHLYRVLQGESVATASASA